MSDSWLLIRLASGRAFYCVFLCFGSLGEWVRMASLVWFSVCLGTSSLGEWACILSWVSLFRLAWCAQYICVSLFWLPTSLPERYSAVPVSTNLRPRLYVCSTYVVILGIPGSGVVGWDCSQVISSRGLIPKSHMRWDPTINNGTLIYRVNPGYRVPTGLFEHGFWLF